MESKIMPNTPNQKAIDRSTYKYCIKSIYENLNQENKRAFILQCTINRIPRATLDVYMKIKMNQKADVPALRLDVIAVLLNVTTERLKNYTISKAPKDGLRVLQTHK